MMILSNFLFCCGWINAGMAIDQGIAYTLLLVALAITYLLHWFSGSPITMSLLLLCTWSIRSGDYKIQILCIFFSLYSPGEFTASPFVVCTWIWMNIISLILFSTNSWCSFIYLFFFWPNLSISVSGLVIASLKLILTHSNLGLIIHIQPLCGPQ